MYGRFTTSTFLLAILSALLLIVTVVGAVLFMQALQGTRSKLDATRIDLVSAQTQNSALQGINGELESSLEHAGVRIEALDASVQSLSGELTDSRAHNADLSQANSDLAVNLDSSMADNARLVDLVDKLQEELSLEVERHGETSRLLLGAMADNETLTGELTKERRAHNALVRAVGELDAVEKERDSLAAEVDDLNADIRLLEDLRRPLILDSRRSQLSCTGSMEPKLTCLDEVTWLDNFRPSDIVVGTLISFTTTEDCDGGAGVGIAHRVMDIKVEDGIHYFWPAGDANDEPDGCWIPEGKVRAYMVDVEKGAHPQNADLRNKVNSATRAMITAETRYKETHWRYCGVEPGTPCDTSDGRFQELLGLYQRFVDAIDYSNCWLESAANAIYYSDGRKPLYLPCFLPAYPITVVVQ